ncbi:hypothetical protein SeMB42_g02900 [Synchytrium endobioticum]|uniref:Uncharacterized protein n=1 Tax=Synchytrium endobioticum TaxID=286115 RepID=A0A507DB96_9FUNG|nr:hypothetical protein SeMB42_g02900 [Synchytrium endobioticum]
MHDRTPDSPDSLSGTKTTSLIRHLVNTPIRASDVQNNLAGPHQEEKAVCHTTSPAAIEHNHTHSPTATALVASENVIATRDTMSPCITYNGYVASTADALLLFEAVRLGRLNRVKGRLSELERRTYIRSGSVFVWSEDEAGMKRWTDGVNWSASRIDGSFLVYHEVETRHRSSISKPFEYTIKDKGLIKRAMSVTTHDGRKHRLVSYCTKEHLQEKRLRKPREDPSLVDIAIETHLYPEFGLPYSSLENCTSLDTPSVLEVPPYLGSRSQSPVAMLGQGSHESKHSDSYRMERFPVSPPLSATYESDPSVRTMSGLHDADGQPTNQDTRIVRLPSIAALLAHPQTIPSSAIPRFDHTTTTEQNFITPPLPGDELLKKCYNR